jgi:hypothetical protein
MAEKKQPSGKEQAQGCMGCLGLIVVIAVVAVVISAASSGGKGQTPRQQAAGYISKARRDIQMVQANVQVAEIDLGLAIKDSSQSNVNQVAQAAQQAHDALDNIKDDLALDGSTGSSSLDNAETQVFGACEELRDAMFDLVTYSGNPNPATLARLNSKFETGRGDWNSAVRYIWHVAQQAGPPTV